jgi:FMN-dependent NADH-azoreductase
MNKFSLFFLATILGFTTYSSAQNIGNEWINYNQSYYKCKVYQDGFYKISISALTNIGLPAGVLGDNLQLYRDGVEQPIFVSNTGVLSSTDFIEFYGEKANGNVEKRLYKDSTLNLNPTQNLVSDTAVYFITYNNASGHKRYHSLPNILINLPVKENYCLVSQRFNYRNSFTAGPSAAEGQYQNPIMYHLNLSHFQQEGYIKSITSNKDSIVVNCTNPYIDPSAPNVSIKTTVVGRGYIGNHNIKLYANNNLLGDTTYARFDFVRLNRSFPMSTISASNTFKIMYEPSGIANDNYGISSMEIKYPVTYDFNNLSSFKFEIEPKLASHYIEIINFNHGGGQPVLYNLTTSNYILGDISIPGIVRFLLPASGTASSYVLQSKNDIAYKSTLGLTNVSFKNFTQNSYQGNYIIITDSKYTNDGNGNNYVESYKNYRSSLAGGAYNSTVAFVNDIYNEFGYGYDFSGLAIRNFLEYAYTNASWTDKPKHVFIIGKGLEYNTYLAYKAASSLAYPFTAVPTFGQPGSDLLFTDFGSNDRPVMSIGRLSAFNANDIKTYLDKVKDQEIALTNTNQTSENKMWQKRVLQIAGASDSLQLLPIVSSLEKHKKIIENPFFGANATNVYKSSNAEQESINNTIIDSFINNGSSIVQFFGHSSASTIDYGLDFPEKYTNFKKYPLMIANGCGAGNIFLFTGQKYLSERFLFTPNAGAIGFLASVNTGFSGYLGFYTDSLYARIGMSMYGQCIGEQLINNITSLISLPNFQNDFLFKMHAEQILLNGDPAIRLAASTLPDYSIELKDIVIKQSDLSLAMDSFDVSVLYNNLGKYSSDSVEIVVKRRLNDFTEKTLLVQKVPGFSNNLPLNLRVPIMGDIGKGTNQLIVSIDRYNTITEMSETNNTSTRTFVIRSSGITPVYPSEFSIIGNQGVTLKASTLNPFEEIMDYTFEIDTTEQFNSPLKQSSVITSAGGVVKWTPTLVYNDSVVYYWRTSNNNGSAVWATSSFIYIDQSLPGWNQSHYYQFQKDDYSKINLDSASRQFTYTSTNKLLQVQNVCMNGAVPFNYIWPEYLVKMNGSTLYTFGCDPYPGYSSLQFIVIDTLTGKPWLNTRPDINVAMGKYGSFDPCRIANGSIKEDPFFEFSFISAASRKTIMDFIDSIPAGYYVMIQPRLCAGSGCGIINSTFIRHWKTDTTTLGSNVSLYHKLKNMGFNTIDSFYKNRPMIFWTQKNVPASVKQYVGADATVKLYGEFDYKILQTEGAITTPRIGPASVWNDFQRSLYTLDQGSDDKSMFLIYGIGKDQKELLIAKVQNDTSLSFIDANQYPYLKIEMLNADKRARTPEQMKYWRIYYTPMPEAALNPASLYSVSEGSMLNTKLIRIAIENLTNVPMDSMLISFYMYDRFNNKTLIESKRYQPLLGADTIVVEYELSTLNMYSNMKFEVEVNPLKDQVEQFHPNNIGLRSMSLIDPTLPLPVTLKEFVVYESDCSTKIKWTVNDEVNFSHYNIERKVATNFETIASVYSTGNEGIQHYSYIDTKPNPAVYVYRLKMVDIDSKFQYSPEKALRINCNQENSDIQLYPNPAGAYTNLMVKNESDGYYEIRIINSIGQQVYHTSLEVLNETKVISLPIEQLPTGIYSVLIHDGITQKVIKLTKE